MTEATKDTARDTAVAAAAGAGLGAAAWGGVGVFANVVGFTSSGIAAGSTAASWMSAAAVANGGGVAAGSFVATMQSVGAVGLATPIGLGLVAGGAVVFGGAKLFHTVVTSRGDAPCTSDSEVGATGADGGLFPADSWIVITLRAASEGGEDREASPETAVPSPAPEASLFESEEAARVAYMKSTARSKALFAPGKRLVSTTEWSDIFSDIVAAL